MYKAKEELKEKKRNFEALKKNKPKEKKKDMLNRNKDSKNTKPEENNFLYEILDDGLNAVEQIDVKPFCEDY